MQRSVRLDIGSIIQRKRVVGQNEYETEIGVVIKTDVAWNYRAFVKYPVRDWVEILDGWIYPDENGKFQFTRPEEHWLLTMPNNEQSI